MFDVIIADAGPAGLNAALDGMSTSATLTIHATPALRPFTASSPVMASLRRSCGALAASSCDHTKRSNSDLSR